MSRTDKNTISINESKILRIIFGGIQEDGTWRRRSNLELYHSYKVSDIIFFIKVQRIKWAGHVVRMDQDHITKKVFNKLAWRKGRRNRRRIDCLEKTPYL
ncbi:uncharacterized protein TNCV_848321 [Trichonephila clavipes]|uniref:Uncharacterized protein n=1 Tax=Trichonephila clavipes TaxID=2585209 RepID=A0A8X6RPJ5_TRICX|nr:uncharacterized protein TNCV_848321 [Trichonephila clavipes]